MFKLLLLGFLSFSLSAKSLESMISNMIIIGFEGEKLPLSLATHIQNHGLGGVILFSKNIQNPQQLKALTSSIKALDKSVFIATDQEGGLVQRLGAKNGFYDTPKPVDVGKMDDATAKVIYTKMADMLFDYGITMDFAPCVDLAKNPKNRVIYRYGRAFSSSPKEVVHFGKIFMDALEDVGVMPVLKHFPGHGSSVADSHRGFVDVSESWGEEELIPFKKLIPKAIMTAHIFNRHLDAEYPATLSLKTNGILRGDGYDGLLISDDLQMGAISKNYDLNQTLTLAIGASVDMVLFGNQLAKPIMIEALVARIKALVLAGKIPRKEIEVANSRIERMKKEHDARR